MNGCEVDVTGVIQASGGGGRLLGFGRPQMTNRGRG